MAIDCRFRPRESSSLNSEYGIPEGNLSRQRVPRIAARTLFGGGAGRLFRRLEVGLATGEHF